MHPPSSPLLFPALLTTLLGWPTITHAYLDMIGCFSDAGGDDFVDMGPYIFQSRGYCGQKCIGISSFAFGLVNGTNCLCGRRIPPVVNLVGEENCDVRCPGYAPETCGGEGFITVGVMDGYTEEEEGAESLRSTSVSHATRTGLEELPVATPVVGGPTLGQFQAGADHTPGDGGLGPEL